MPELTSFKVLTLIAKLYTGYAYSLAFIFQSSLVLILASMATIGYMFLKEHHFSTKLQATPRALKLRQRLRSS